MPESAEFDTKLYQHPDTWHDDSSQEDFYPTYRKSYDICSPGVVFVELAFWLPMEDVLAKLDLDYYRTEHRSDIQTETMQDKQRRSESILDKNYARARPGHALMI